MQAQPTGPSPPGAADFKALLGVCGRLPARPPPARLAAHRLDPGQGPASSHWNDWQNYSTWLRYSSKLDYSTRLLRSGWLRAPPPLDMPPLFGYTQCTQTAIFVCHCSDLVAPSLGSPRRQNAASTVDLAGPKQKKPTLFLFFLKCRLLFGSFKHQTRYSSVALFKTVARWTIVQAGRLREDPNPGGDRLANLPFFVGVEPQSRNSVRIQLVFSSYSLRIQFVFSSFRAFLLCSILLCFL